MKGKRDTSNHLRWAPVGRGAGQALAQGRQVGRLRRAAQGCHLGWRPCLALSPPRARHATQEPGGPCGRPPGLHTGCVLGLECLSLPRKLLFILENLTKVMSFRSFIEWTFPEVYWAGGESDTNASGVGCIISTEGLCPPDSYVEILTPSAVVLGGRPSGAD